MRPYWRHSAARLLVPAAGGGPSGLYVLHASSMFNATSVTFPDLGGFQEGDVAILMRFNANSLTPTVSGSGASAAVVTVNQAYLALHTFKLAPGDTGLTWGAVRYGAYAIVRGCDPTTPVSSSAAAGNSASGLDQTAPRDGSMNVQIGTFGSAGSSNPSGQSFVVDINETLGSFSASFCHRIVNVADGALGAGVTYEKIVVPSRIMLQPPVV